MPGFDLTRSEQHTPAGCQREKRNQLGRVGTQVVDVERVKELRILRKRFTAPDVPTARAVLRRMTKRVERCQLKCGDSYTKLFIFTRWLEGRTILAANVELRWHVSSGLTTS